MQRSEWIVKYLKGKVCEIKDIQEFFKIEGIEVKNTKCPHCNRMFKLSSSNSKCITNKISNNTIEFIVNGYSYYIDFKELEKRQVEIINVKYNKVES